MPERKAPTQAQIGRAQEKVIRTLLNFLDHKRKIRHKPGAFQMVLLDIAAYSRSLPDGVRPFVLAFLLCVLERDRAKFVKASERKFGRRRDQIEAAESDATPQAEVNAAVRQMFRRSSVFKRRVSRRDLFPGSRPKPHRKLLELPSRDSNNRHGCLWWASVRLPRCIVRAG